MIPQTIWNTKKPQGRGTSLTNNTAINSQKLQKYLATNGRKIKINNTKKFIEIFKNLPHHIIELADHSLRKIFFLQWPFLQTTTMNCYPKIFVFSNFYLMHGILGNKYHSQCNIKTKTVGSPLKNIFIT